MLVSYAYHFQTIFDYLVYIKVGFESYISRGGSSNVGGWSPLPHEQPPPSPEILAIVEKEKEEKKEEEERERRGKNSVPSIFTLDPPMFISLHTTIL